MDTEIRIMVVDDDHDELDRTLDAIRKHGVGYEARIAMGGFEAIDYLLGHGRFHERRRHPLPDLVLLDLGMAPLDGIAVLRHARKSEQVKHIPVIILCKTEEERERARQGAPCARAYALKPLTAESLHDLLVQVGPWPMELRRKSR